MRMTNNFRDKAVIPCTSQKREKLAWKMTFAGRHPSPKDDLQLKMALDGRLPLRKDDI